MKKRILGSLSLWLAAVISVATLASLAIDTAGRQVTAGRITAPLPRDLAAMTTRPTLPPTPSTSTIDPPKPAVNSHTKRSAVRSSAARPPARPSERPVERSSAPSTKSLRRPVTSTYSSSGGRIKVACQGERVTLDGGFAQPAPEWAVKVLDRGPDSVVVGFGSGRVGIVVVAVCVQGSPRFSKKTIELPADSDAPASGHDGGYGFFSD